MTLSPQCVLHVPVIGSKDFGKVIMYFFWRQNCVPVNLCRQS
jgi:hypothetical protein